MRIVVVGGKPEEYLTAAVRATLPQARFAIVTDLDALAAELGAAALVILPPSCVNGRRAAEAIAAVRALDGGVPLLAVGTEDRAALAVGLLKAGATDYVLVDGDELATALRGLAIDPLAGDPGDIPGLVGRSAAMREVRALVRVAAATDAQVLLEGETGTGKEVVARAIHALGRRANRPLVPVNCAAVPEGLAESEFFGHVRGAFTGALQEHPGALRLADGGTLFLDEIEDLPLALQAKLLRVVQDREVRPLGGSSGRRIDVRLVAASNQDLAQMVDAGRFRSDLYYRLRVLTIRLPPLRERREDLPGLVEHFVRRFNERHHARFVTPSSTACRPLMEHPWPGNVRELENTLEAVLTLAHATGTDFALALRRRTPGAAGFWGDERTRLLRVLEANRWNRQRSATTLGISRVTLWRRMERHGIRDPLKPTLRETA